MPINLDLKYRNNFFITPHQNDASQFILILHWQNYVTLLSIYLEKSS